MKGRNIKKLREARGWSQRQLGEYLGIEQATVSRLENDEWPASGPVVKLLEALETQSSGAAA